MQTTIILFLKEKAFELAVKFLTDETAIKKARQSILDKVTDMVNDTETPWDNVAGKAVLKVFGYTDAELKDI